MKKKVTFFSFFCANIILCAPFLFSCSTNGETGNQISLSEWKEDTIPYLTTKNQIDIENGKSYKLTFALSYFKNIESFNTFYINFEKPNFEEAKFSNVSGSLNGENINESIFVIDGYIKIQHSLSANDNFVCNVKFSESIKSLSTKFSAARIIPAQKFSVTLEGDDKDNVESSNNQMSTDKDFTTQLTSKDATKTTVIVEKVKMGGLTFSDFSFDEISHEFSIKKDFIKDDLFIYVKITDAPPREKANIKLEGEFKDFINLSNKNVYVKQDYDTNISSSDAERPEISVKEILINNVKFENYTFKKLSDDLYALHIDGEFLLGDISLNLNISKKQPTFFPVSIGGEYKKKVTISQDHADVGKDFVATLAFTDVETRIINVYRVTIGDKPSTDFQYDKTTNIIKIDAQYIKGDIVIFPEINIPKPGDKLTAKLVIDSDYKSDVKLSTDSAKKSYDFSETLISDKVDDFIINKVLINGHQYSKYEYDSEKRKIFIFGGDVDGNIEIHINAIQYFKIDINGSDEDVLVDKKRAKVGDDLILTFSSTDMKKVYFDINRLEIDGSPKVDYKLENNILIIHKRCITGNIHIVALSSSFLYSVSITGDKSNFVKINKTKAIGGRNFIAHLNAIDNPDIEITLIDVISGSYSIKQYSTLYKDENYGWIIEIDGKNINGDIKIELDFTLSDWNVYGGTNPIYLKWEKTDDNAYKIKNWSDSIKWTLYDNELKPKNAHWRLENFKGRPEFLGYFYFAIEEITEQGITYGCIKFEETIIGKEAFQRIQSWKEGSFDIVASSDDSTEYRTKITLDLEFGK